MQPRDPLERWLDFTLGVVAGVAFVILLAYLVRSVVNP